MVDKLLLKDILVNKKKIQLLSVVLKKAYPTLDQKKFEKDIVKKFPQLELKERIHWITKNIKEYLPNDYEVTLQILIHSLKDEEQTDMFVYASYSDYVEMYGSDKKYLKKSLTALGEFTKHFSAEFAIRLFINKFPKETFEKMQKWSMSKNVHQRRLASEGLRPKLPWAVGITFDYKKGVSVLDNLFYDAERYVTRSVANHLNDISKFDPDFVVQILKKWKKSKKQNDVEMKYIIQHSLRTSIKKGHTSTLAFLGYNSDCSVVVNKLKLKEKEIKINESVEFSFEIEGKKEENLIIDYKIIYPNPTNRHSEKVFKIKTATIKKGERLVVVKKHAFKVMTTKKLYSGEYTLEVQINGRTLASTMFSLEV